jgi:hypothetical protein
MANSRFDGAIEEALGALKDVSARDLLRAARTLERREDGDSRRFGGVFRSVAYDRRDGDEPGRLPGIYLRCSVYLAGDEFLERIADAPAPFWRHVRAAIGAYRAERSLEPAVHRPGLRGPAHAARRTSATAQAERPRTRMLARSLYNPRDAESDRSL